MGLYVVAAAPATQKEKRQSACASEGVDWEELGRKVGGVAATQNDYELCAFVSHQDTGCTAGLYRSARAQLLVTWNLHCVNSCAFLPM